MQTRTSLQMQSRPVDVCRRPVEVPTEACCSRFSKVLEATTTTTCMGRLSQTHDEEDQAKAKKVEMVEKVEKEGGGSYNYQITAIQGQFTVEGSRRPVENAQNSLSKAQIKLSSIQRSTTIPEVYK